MWTEITRRGRRARGKTRREGHLTGWRAMDLWATRDGSRCTECLGCDGGRGRRGRRHRAKCAARDSNSVIFFMISSQITC